MLSGMLGYIFYYKASFFMPMMDALLEATCDGDNNYIVVICLLFGCFVLLLTWLCGIIIFIDDYLSILVTENCVMSLSDEHKTSREMLCYIINTTSAPVCLIIPISAWVVFFSGVFEQQKEAAVVGSSAMDIYYHIMPYFFYPFLCVIFVLLVILGVIPKMGAISDDSNSEEKEIKPHLWAFVVLMAVVIIVALWLDDILYGVACGIVAWFPAIAFILIGLVCFATGNIWSVHAVCTPIILPMAAACGASIPLTLGSIISAACFGAQACFYSDVTLLSASAYRINNVDYAVAQLPDIGIVTAITFVGYIAAGFMMS